MAAQSRLTLNNGKDGQYELTAISPVNPGAAGAKAMRK
jgi:hypothetical protein